MQSIIQILRSGSLAGCAGLRAFAPVFVIMLLVRAGAFDKNLINPDVRHLLVNNNTLFFIVGILFAFEIISEKVPSLSNFATIFNLIVRPMAGSFSAFSALNLPKPEQSIVLCIILGLALTVPIHGTIIRTRMMKRKNINWKYNLFLSFTEDVVAFAFSILAIVKPVIAIVILPLSLLVFTKIFTNWRTQLLEKKSRTGLRRKDMEEEQVEIKKLKKLQK